MGIIVWTALRVRADEEGEEEGEGEGSGFCFHVKEGRPHRTYPSESIDCSGFAESWFSSSFGFGLGLGLRLRLLCRAFTKSAAIFATGSTS